MKQSEITKLIKVLAEFRGLYPDISVNHVMTFLEVAKGQGTSSQRIEKTVGITQSAASRNLRFFDEWQKSGMAGQNLFEERVDPSDIRAKLRYLNANGKKFLAKLEKAAGDKS